MKYSIPLIPNKEEIHCTHQKVVLATTELGKAKPLAILHVLAWLRL